MESFICPEAFLKPYDPAGREPEMLELWEKSGYANPDVCVEKGVTAADAEPYSIVLPPPNVTGTLHMGHAAMLAIEDILIRYHRMRGYKTLWVPGTDSAAIATQAKVETDIYKKEKKTRHDLGREELMRRIDAFVEESKATIINQTKKMGSSLDWSRYSYTMDEKRTDAVSTAFIKMSEAGLIYRGNRIVNWDPKLQTTVSDDEIEYVEQKDPFYYFQYGPFVIGTVRPETKFGDKYVVMHPEDERYKEFTHGQQIELEWINGPITATVIKDKAADMETGSGVMTITPAHSMIDFEIASRHNLDVEQVIDDRGILLSIAGEFAGQHIKKARSLIVEKLQAKGLLVKTDENYVHNVATNSRGGGIIEPQIKRQWFIAVNKEVEFPDGKTRTLKEWMREAVEAGSVKIMPERFDKIYYHWIDNLRDWCISRQIWFGHRIPVWYDLEHAKVTPTIEATRTMKGGLSFPGNQQEWSDVSEKELPLISVTYLLTEPSAQINFLGKEIVAKEIKEKIAELNRLATIKLEDPAVKFVIANTYEEASDKLATPYVYQESDVLDTWFSSGLWTFSTLGWPEETSDLHTYHPTSVLETGYDILFFWVARMILMSGFLLGQVPFKNVYLHGLVRDGQGRKMSKSLGNIIDPLTMIEKYGADATRLSLIIGASMGNDVKLSEDRVRGYKHFANKLWNITRFILENGSAPDVEFSKRDLELIEQRNQVIQSVSGYIEEFNLNQAADLIYHYTWDQLAAEILEESKTILRGTDEAAANSRRKFLNETLFIVLKLLHPFMPFVTEAIWQQLPEKECDLLMVAKWPVAPQGK